MKWERKRAEVGMACGLLLCLVLFGNKPNQRQILVKGSR